MRRLKDRINKMRGSFTDQNPDFRKALVRIGYLLENRMILNIRGHHLIDTGRLLNSMEHRISKKGDVFEILAGSFGVKYAAQHEFGLTVSVPSYNKRAYTRKDGAQVRAHAVRGHTRKYTEKPFIRPAFYSSTRDIVRILREVAR